MEKILEVVRIKQVTEERHGIIREGIGSPDDVVQVAHYFIGDEDREVLLVIGLNTKNQINVVNRCHIGTINASIVHPREIFKVLILNNCNAFIIAHNHPTHDVSPSAEDKMVTKKLYECGKILGIELLDSLIVTEDLNRYYSFREQGQL